MEFMDLILLVFAYETIGCTHITLFQLNITQFQNYFSLSKTHKSLILPTIYITIFQQGTPLFSPGFVTFSKLRRVFSVLKQIHMFVLFSLTSIVRMLVVWRFRGCGSDYLHPSCYLIKREDIMHKHVCKSERQNRKSGKTLGGL